jgi:hypothetical protein
VELDELTGLIAVEEAGRRIFPHIFQHHPDYRRIGVTSP